jgi:hypothetical protein
VIGEYWLRGHAWRWILCFGALSAGMCALDVATYPASPHIEWPAVHYRGAWLSSFLWIRDHTPKDALFALDPEYLLKPGVDLHVGHVRLHPTSSTPFPYPSISCALPC